MISSSRKRNKSTRIDQPVGEKRALQGVNTLPAETAFTVIDYALVVSLVFGGCCTNAWSLEMLLKQGTGVGSALTFSQMTFIAVQALPSFLSFRSKGGQIRWIPHLKRRAIPLSTWLVQVFLLVCMSLLNNWAFAYHVPLTVQIVVRSSGLAVSMLFGYFTLGKSYTYKQITAVILVTAGVVLATLSGPSASLQSFSSHDLWRYAGGISMLLLASLLTGYYGTLQEQTYTQYGPHWKEGVFYTHLLSLPTFLFLKSDVRQGLFWLSQSYKGAIFGISYSYLVLALNLLTQLLCTSSVNNLSSKVSSVTTNLVLTTRKALSLCISVWWFGNAWDRKLSLGAMMVFSGTILYTLSGSNGSHIKSKKERGD